MNTIQSNIATPLAQASQSQQFVRITANKVTHTGKVQAVNGDHVFVELPAKGVVMLTIKSITQLDNL